jgi:predicted amidohydrolase
VALTVETGTVAALNDQAVTLCSKMLLVVNVSCVCGLAVDGADVTLNVTGANHTAVQVTGTTDDKGATAFLIDMTTEAVAEWSFAPDAYRRWTFPHGPPVFGTGLKATYLQVFACGNPQLFAAVWHINTEKKKDGTPAEPRLAGTSIQNRLDGLVQALTIAAANIPSVHDLCVFVAPEYYFLGSTADDHYLTAEQKNVLLQNFAAATRNSPFLIFGGSVGWYEGAADTDADLFDHYFANLDTEAELPANAIEQRKVLRKFMTDEVLARQSKNFVKRDHRLRIVHNTALIASSGGMFLYDKRFESIDENLLTNEIPAYKNDFWRHSVFYPGRGQPLLSYCGFNFGIEICADHESASLLSFAAAPDVHVVCSAHVDVFKEHMACHDNGYLVNADSQASGVYDGTFKAVGPIAGPIDTNPGRLVFYRLPLE